MVVYKQVIIVRHDLKLPKGKLASQVAHASVDAVFCSDKDTLKRWRAEGMKKIVVKVQSEAELYRYAMQAKEKGLPVAIITDAGKTVVAPGTTTCVAIGPAKEQSIDEITQDIPLL